MSVCKDVYVIGGSGVRCGQNYFVCAEGSLSCLCVHPPPPIWFWMQVPSNVPLTTKDLAALVPEVSDPLMSYDFCSSFPMTLNGL